MRTLLMVSGGDAPGINAALYRFTLLAEHYGDQVVGAVGGPQGAAAGHLVDLRSEMLAPYVGLGGTFLATSREPALRDPVNRIRLIETVSRQRIDNIVLFGGDGSLRHIPPILLDMGIRCVGIPTTIDNDVPGTDETIGFDSACNAALPVIDALLATARALPGRIFSVETLGGATGFIALAVAHAASAQAVLIPEKPFDETWLVERLKTAVQDAHYALVVLSEGIPGSRTWVDHMQTRHGLRIRDTRLGHGQRGTQPTYRDRQLAFTMIDSAFAALHDSAEHGTVLIANQQVAFREGLITELPARQPDDALYRQINGLS
jgi:6-phosphofructokinase 1